MFFQMGDGDIVNIEYIKCLSGLKQDKKENGVKYYFDIYFKDNSKLIYSVTISIDNIIKSIENTEYTENYIKFKNNYEKLSNKLLGNNE